MRCRDFRTVAELGRMELKDLIALSSLGGEDMTELREQIPQHRVDEVLRRADAMKAAGNKSTKGIDALGTKTKGDRS